MTDTVLEDYIPKLRSITILAIGAFVLAGCVSVVPLAIVDLQTDKVIVQADHSEKPTAVVEKAREGCAIHGRTPYYLSEWEQCSGTSCYTSAPQVVGTSVIGGNTFCGPSDCAMRHLFACVE